VIVCEILPRHLVEGLAWLVRPLLLLAAAEHPSETEADVEECLAAAATGEALVILIRDDARILAAALCEIQPLRDGDALHVRYLGGRGMEAWLDRFLACLDTVARGEGCGWVSMTGREGWRRTLGSHGWAQVAVTMRGRVNGDEGQQQQQAEQHRAAI
jgi:hypothetical protein